MDVGAFVLLAHAMDAGAGLLVIAHGVVQRVEHHERGRRQRNSQARRRNLPDEYRHVRIVLEGGDLRVPIPDLPGNLRIPDFLLLEHLPDSMNLRHEPGNHDDLPAIRHRAVHQIGQGVQFGRRYLRNASGIVVPDVPACQLRQPQQLRQYVGDGYAALGQLRVAIPDELPVYPHGLRLKVDPLHNISEFRKVEAFGFGCPEGDAVQALREFALHGSLHHRRVSAEAHHIEVAVPELIEGIPVDGRVAELVL